uniref:Potassium channel domain-containing protein n=1 Tax=Panagrolaimus sp. ES5 TaxID=591445 RepID=A0AC34FFX0_9BILA
MVVAVAAYVIIGAWTIRSIEATPRTSEFDAGYATKVMLRSRRCVVIALRKLAEKAKCERSSLTKDLMFELDECYEEDIKNLITQAKEDAAAAKSSQNDVPTLPPTTPKEAADEKEKEEVEWVYWSMTDAILFCFTVITTIG